MICIAGHKESFKNGTKPGTLLKKNTGNEEINLRKLEQDELASFVPRFVGTIKQDEHVYLEMQDLLADFKNASVMDVKMGCRTYLEDELGSALQNPKLRPDMYEKMVEIDESEPSEEERQAKAITKPRYMVWRETISSTATLGFRIEGMRLKDGTFDKNFKTIRDEDQIVKAFMRFVKSHSIRLVYLNRLYDLRRALLKSKFFATHEMIGSSLLFVHDDSKASIWLIDFAKTHHLPPGVNVTHSSKWELGNHEDGYMTGINNLIRIFESIILIQILCC